MQSGLTYHHLSCFTNNFIKCHRPHIVNINKTIYLEACNRFTIDMVESSSTEVKCNFT